jgi:uncharacterized protein involved in exopolysaccharide biosynthesis
MDLNVTPPTMFGGTPLESDAIDIASIVRAVLKKWRAIAVVTGFFTFVSLFLVMTAKPQFTIGGTLYLGDAQSGSNAQPSSVTFLAPFLTDSNVATQVELIRARPLVERAILETGLNA